MEGEQYLYSLISVGETSDGRPVTERVHMSVCAVVRKKEGKEKQALGLTTGHTLLGWPDFAKHVKEQPVVIGGVESKRHVLSGVVRVTEQRPVTL